MTFFDFVRLYRPYSARDSRIFAVAIAENGDETEPIYHFWNVVQNASDLCDVLYDYKVVGITNLNSDTDVDRVGKNLIGVILVKGDDDDQD